MSHFKKVFLCFEDIPTACKLYKTENHFIKKIKERTNKNTIVRLYAYKAGYFFSGNYEYVFEIDDSFSDSEILRIFFESVKDIFPHLINQTKIEIY